MTPQDPLAQLRDIHLPEPVSAWPPGPGWWLLAALLLVSAVALAWWLVARYRRNAWRRQANAELDQIFAQWQASADDRSFLQALNEILKRAALLSADDQPVAGLCGEAWSRYLDSRWPQAPERGFSTLEFSEWVYQPEPRGIEIAELHSLGRRWLREATC